MQQELTSEHRRDAYGRPAGGETEAIGLSIRWQDGPLGRGPGRAEPNGAFVETVIAAALDRLRFYQGTPFACTENAEAIGALQQALVWCHRRTERREARGIEGTHDVDSTEVGIPGVPSIEHQRAQAEADKRAANLPRKATRSQRAAKKGTAK